MQTCASVGILVYNDVERTIYGFNEEIVSKVVEVTDEIIVDIDNMEHIVGIVPALSFSLQNIKGGEHLSGNKGQEPQRLWCVQKSILEFHQTQSPDFESYLPTPYILGI